MYNGISAATYYAWRAKYGGLGVSDLHGQHLYRATVAFAQIADAERRSEGSLALSESPSHAPEARP